MSLMWLVAAAPVLMLKRQEAAQGQERKAKSQAGCANSFCSMLNSIIKNACSSHGLRFLSFMQILTMISNQARTQLYQREIALHWQRLSHF